MAEQLKKRRVTIESTAITIHVYTYILVSDNARREITHQEMVSERWEEVSAAVLVCLLGEAA